MMTQKRQKYDREFKRKAVELSFARGNAKEIAEELGIRPELLYRWKKDNSLKLLAFHGYTRCASIYALCTTFGLELI